MYQGNFLSLSWLGFSWSNFISFHSKSFGDVPPGAGVYRVRVRGEDVLAYVGQTGRSLRERLRALSIHTLADEMPFNDPHTAAPRLWSYKVARGYEFECSVCEIELSRQERMALECFLIWQYRIERGNSPLCNFGRLHEGYVTSWNRKTGKRGGLHHEERKGSLDSSLPPLHGCGQPHDDSWCALDWSEFFPLTRKDILAAPSICGLYRLKEAGSGELLYIGEAENLSKRLCDHLSGPWRGREVLVSVCVLSEARAKCQRLEIESDLIGAYYGSRKKPPIFQFERKVPGKELVPCNSI